MLDRGGGMGGRMVIVIEGGRDEVVFRIICI